MMSSSPGRVWQAMASWFPIVPEDTKSAASFPVISATAASSRRTLGSSPNTSSPTSASAIARRIACVGRVTVSLRRSIGCAGGASAIARTISRPCDRAVCEIGCAARRSGQIG
jgi:hypothetical protein